MAALDIGTVSVFQAIAPITSRKMNCVVTQLMPRIGIKCKTSSTVLTELSKEMAGRVPETFDAAFDFFSELRNRGIEHMKGKEKLNLERQTRWAKNRRW